MTQLSTQIRTLADAMSSYGFALGREADSVTKHELIAIANSLQANVDILLELSQALPDDSLN